MKSAVASDPGDVASYSLGGRLHHGVVTYLLPVEVSTTDQIKMKWSDEDPQAIKYNFQQILISFADAMKSGTSG